MMATVAFADDQHDVWRAEAAAIYLHLVGSMNQLGNLMRCQLVGIDAEVESVDRQIEYGMIFLCEGVLYLSDGSSRHQLMVSLLVVPGGADGSDEDGQAEDTEGGWHGCCHSRNSHQSFLERCQFEYGNEEDVDLDEPFPEDDDEYLQERQEQNPAHTAEEHFGRDEGREEAASLGTVGFSHQHQHRRIECGTEIHEAVGISGCRDI